MKDLIYNELVATPGYELDFAVGTTYSLDAEAYLAVALSFARLGEAGLEDFNNPLRLLEGLRQANKKIAVFCNRGGLKPPVRTNALYAMLDQSVFEVADTKNPLANFHPKIWLIKEHAIDNRSLKQIKLIVMSRNLTRDNSLDIAATMTAPLGEKPSAALRAKHEPIKSLLLRLAEKSSPEKRKAVKRLAADVDTMGRFELADGYEDYDFLPLYFGVPLNPGIDFRTEIPAEKLAIVSPFIDLDTLTWMTDYRSKSEKVLITRIDSVTPQIMDLFSDGNRSIWVPTDLMEQNDVQPMNLHAKMYFSWGPKSGGIHQWLGSANATQNGFSRNSEFLLRLTLRRGQNQFQKFLAEFCDPEKQMFRKLTLLQETEPPRINKSLSMDVRRILLRQNNLTAKVEHKGTYHICITARRVEGINGDISVAPIQEPHNMAVLSHETKCCEIEVADAARLSEFYILTVMPHFDDIEPIKLAIKIPTEGIPEDRDDRIFRSLLDTRDKFMNYIAMMITDSPMQLSEMLCTSREVNLSSCLSGYHPYSGLYESLIRLASTNPERLNDIREVVDKLDTAVVPESFLQMVEVFKSTIKKLR